MNPCKIAVWDISSHTECLGQQCSSKQWFNLLLASRSSWWYVTLAKMQPHPWKVQPSLQMLTTWSTCWCKRKVAGNGGMKCVDFQEEFLDTKPKNVQKFLHAYLNPRGTSAKKDTFPLECFRKHPTDTLQNHENKHIWVNTLLK